ncbi:MAG: cytochrome c maturation protein CcmE [Myxococcales bacterium]|nr:cytochrome c maturation protein CcmE [Myxococcales bacterium]
MLPVSPEATEATMETVRKGRVMKKLLFGVASVVAIGGVLGYVLVSTASNAFQYYKHVDEVVPSLMQWQKKPLELHGFVLPGSIKKRLDREHQRLEYRFTETNCGKQIEVFYAGTVPDTFKDGAEVVVKGKLDGANFNATEIMAKCPSKYQATVGPSTMCSQGDAQKKAM